MGTLGGGVIPAFLFARVARIFPLWWICLAIIATVWVVKPDWVFAQISGTPNLLADFFLWPHERKPLLAVGWTLIHEMYFYVVFALALFFPIQYFWKIIVAWLFFVVIGNLTAYSNGTELYPLIDLVTHPLTLEFVVGLFVGFLAINGYRFSVFATATFGVLWLIVGWFLVAEIYSFKAYSDLFKFDWLRVAILAPSLGAILYSVIILELNWQIVPLKKLALLGDASYALYLIHVPVFAALARLTQNFYGPATWDNFIGWILLLGIASVTAILLHRAVEVRVLKYLTGVRWKILPEGSALLSQPQTLNQPEK